MALRARQDNQGTQALPVPQETPGPRGRRASLALQGLRELQDQLVLQETLEHKDHKVLRERQDQPATMAHQDQLEELDQLDHKDQEAVRDQQDKLEDPVPQDSRVLRVLQGSQDPWVLQGPPVSLETMVRRDNPGLLVLTVRLVLQEYQGHREL